MKLVTSQNIPLCFYRAQALGKIKPFCFVLLADAQESIEKFINANDLEGLMSLKLLLPQGDGKLENVCPSNACAYSFG